MKPDAVCLWIAGSRYLSIGALAFEIQLQARWLQLAAVDLACGLVGLSLSVLAGQRRRIDVVASIDVYRIRQFAAFLYQGLCHEVPELLRNVGNHEAQRQI